MFDKLFLDEFVVKDIYERLDLDKKTNIFESEKIYLDYTNMSKKIMDYYHFSLQEIEDLMRFEKEIDIEKYRSNVNVIKETVNDNLRYIDINHFISFLEVAANQIYIYIKKEKIL